MLAVSTKHLQAIEATVKGNFTVLKKIKPVANKKRKKRSYKLLQTFY